MKINSKEAPCNWLSGRIQPTVLPVSATERWRSSVQTACELDPVQTDADSTLLHVSGDNKGAKH
jgi:hypothetical protein